MFFAALMAGGLLVTTLSVIGVIVVARRYKNQDAAGRTLLILAMIGLALFALAGVSAMGCSTIVWLSSLH